MCSILTHPVIPLSFSLVLPVGTASPRLLVAGVACSIVPDFDVVGFRFGIGYGDMLGHRGFTHSVVFAAILGALVTVTLFREDSGSHWTIFLFLFFSTLSHPLLDMLTNGGLGVALLAPFSNERYFFPYRPIQVSPIGFGRFFSEWGLRVLWSEVRWVWLPSTVVFLLGYLVRRFS
jgi:inner membrane protein